MGWSRVSDLKMELAEEAYDGCSLWTRGGLEGVQIFVRDVVVHVPRELILKLVSDEYINNQIGRYEQMTTDQAIAEMMGKVR